MSDNDGLAPSDDAADTTLLADLRASIAAGRGRAASAINAEIVVTYWRLGERIVREEQAGRQRAGYGEQTLAHLGRALSREFGRGFAERTLMRLPADRRDFYARMATSGRWISRELERQIASMLYERASLSRRPETLAPDLPRPDRAPTPADDAFRPVTRGERRCADMPFKVSSFSLWDGR